MISRVMCALAATALVMAVTVGCDDDPAAPETHLVTVVLSKSGVPDGVYAYGKLVPWGQDGNVAPLYYGASTPFSNGTAIVSIADVAQGSYYGYAFIDLNGNATGDGTSMPDGGDWMTDGAGEIIVAGDVTDTIPEQAWVLHN